MNAKDSPTTLTWTEGDGLLMPPPPPGYPPSPLQHHHGPIGRPPGARSRILAAGLGNLAILLSGFVLSTAAAAYVIFLWSCSLALKDDSNASWAPGSAVWRAVALAGWIPMSITISSAVVRAVLGVQFAAAVSMAAAVLLEEKGVPTRLAPLALTLRAMSMPQTWRILQYIGGTLTLDIKTTLAVAVLVATTLASQLFSTLLVSDLGIRPVLNSRQAGPVGFGLNNPPVSVMVEYEGKPYKAYQESTDDAYYWAAGSPDYPIFAEYTGTSTSPDSNSDAPSDQARMLDTGVSLRAFPPFRDSSARAALDGYEGYAAVFDARVNCMTPFVVVNLSVTDFLEKPFWTWATISGHLVVGLPPRARWTVDNPNHMLSERQMVDKFNCSFALPATTFEDTAISGEWAVTLCDLSFDDHDYEIVLESPIYGAGIRPQQLMVFNATGKGDDWKKAMNNTGGRPTWTLTNDTARAPWTHLTAGPLHPNISLDISFCLDSFKYLASIPTRMTRPGRPRPEPVLVWNQNQLEYDTSGVTRLHAGAGSGLSDADRNILTLEGRTNWTEDGVELRQFTAEATSIGDFQNLEILNPDSRISALLCTFCEVSGWSYFRAHRHHVAVFQDILQTTGSLPLAIQAVWTILTQHMYYDFLDEFDASLQARYSLYSDCEVPIRKRGLIFALVFLAVHDVAVLVLAVRFLSRHRMSMPGQLWQGFGQLAASLSGSASSRQGGGSLDGHGYMPYMYHGDEGRDDGDGTSVAEWAVRATAARDLEVRREMRRENGGRPDEALVRLIQEVDDHGAGRLCLRHRAR
ncbi:hypothetical protein B0T19DRAFT_456179 [Cercophora scortea]|uniref:Uncharacterized protein n=1 Tax=Cercophora scortea TaxID=314031 RepID=A0AAE0MGL3_9PEZI|nr:hypothetical protein B0T19DRAFT_456179 [Cercophora scortea]